jgi:hypothetical protein
MKNIKPISVIKVKSEKCRNAPVDLQSAGAVKAKLLLIE